MNIKGIYRKKKAAATSYKTGKPCKMHTYKIDSNGVRSCRRCGYVHQNFKTY